MGTSSKYTGDAKERNRQKAEAWRKRHPGRQAEIQKAFRERNPDKAKEQRQKAERKPEAQEKRRQRQKRHTVEIRLKAIDYLGGKCNHCGQTFHHSAMDFHHVDPSTKEVKGKGIPSNCSWERVLEELVKTILLCANCHRIHHYKERNPECKTFL